MTTILEMLRGLPASGKSTYAKEKVKKDGNWVRVNRDDIRAMLGTRWSPSSERLTVEVEKAIAFEALQMGRNVIVDDTNLGPKHESLWKRFCEEFNDAQENESRHVKFKLTEFDTPFDLCVLRDFGRQNGVGRNVIAKMAARYGRLLWPDNPIVLVDIDGTLADGSHREHLVRTEPKQWDQYLELCNLDAPVVPVFEWVAELSKDHTIVIVSGRGAEREQKTYDWFNKIWVEKAAPYFPVFQWFFRNAGDHRPDDIVKLEVLYLLPRKPVMVIDDRPSVIRAWRSKGLKVIPVRGAIEEF